MNWRCDEARQAERAFNYERGYTARKFIGCENWDNLHEGLLAGERLDSTLRIWKRNTATTIAANTS